jgi:hypothetical protein
MNIKQAKKAEIGIDGGYNGGICPECGKVHVPNAVTLTALREAEAIAVGKIQVEWQRPPATKEELKARLRKMAEESYTNGGVVFARAGTHSDLL